MSIIGFNLPGFNLPHIAGGYKSPSVEGPRPAAGADLSDRMGASIPTPETLLRPLSAAHLTPPAAPNSSLLAGQGLKTAVGLLPPEAEVAKLLVPGSEGQIPMSEFRREAVLEDLNTLRHSGFLLAPEPGFAELLPCQASDALEMMKNRESVYFKSSRRAEAVAIKDFDHLRDLALQAEQKVVG